MLDLEVIDLMKEKIKKDPKRYGKHKNLDRMKPNEIMKIFEVSSKKEETILRSKKNSKNNSKVIIKVEDLTKSFKTKLKINEVHKGLTFNIYEGETLAIIGANGAGKTVLMETLVRIQKQNSGKITFDFNGLDPFEEIGMQFQEIDLNSDLSPKVLIKFMKKFYGNKVVQEQLEEMIDVFGIRPYIKKKIKKLSGGQKQRVNLLLATMHNPKFMILDEFITGLDVLSVKDILEYIAKLKEKNNSTLVIISHQPQEIKTLSDRVLILKDGIIYNEYTNEEIDKEWKGDFNAFVLDSI